jgi:hypothetical protein
VYRLLQVWVLFLLGCGCAQASLSLGLAFTGLWVCTSFPGLDLGFEGLWLCTGYPQSLSCLCWAVVVHRLPPGFGLTYAGLWLCISFPWSCSCLCWSVVVIRLPLDLVLHLVGCGCAKASPSLGLAFAGLWLCYSTHNMGLTSDIQRSNSPGTITSHRDKCSRPDLGSCSRPRPGDDCARPDPSGASPGR